MTSCTLFLEFLNLFRAAKRKSVVKILLSCHFLDIVQMNIKHSHPRESGICSGKCSEELGNSSFCEVRRNLAQQYCSYAIKVVFGTLCLHFDSSSHSNDLCLMMLHLLIDMYKSICNYCNFECY